MWRSASEVNPTAWAVEHAIDVIQSTYWDIVSVDLKKKDLIKFWRNPNVWSSWRFTLRYTGQDQANETYVADNVNSISTISSSNAADTQIVRIEGHTMTGWNRTFVVQTATLNGQNKVTLTTPLNRCTRVSHNDQTSVSIVWEVYVYQDTALTAWKPTDTTKIHLTMPAWVNQSQKASTSLSSTDYWIITWFSAWYLEKSGTNVADIQLEVREPWGVFKPRSNPMIIQTGIESDRRFNPYLVVPKNSDIRITAQSSATGQEITGDVEWYLAIIV